MDHVAASMGLAVAGYALGGWVLALLAGGAWVGLVYYSCYEAYNSFVRETLRTEMDNIEANFLSHPDNCFWVAEAEVNGQWRMAGMVAVVGKKKGGGGRGEAAGCGEVRPGTGGGGEERYGEVFRMIVSSSCRRTGLGSQLAHTAIEFCRKRGFSRVVLETSSVQTAAVALYLKLGFSHTLTHFNTCAPGWVTKMSKLTILHMEKVL